jgi:hypothetical protein
MGWALYAGSVLQLLVIASGVMIPAMYVLGVIFTALWFTGIWLARKVESAQRLREQETARQGAPTPAPLTAQPAARGRFPLVTGASSVYLAHDMTTFRPSQA